MVSYFNNIQKNFENDPLTLVFELNNKNIKQGLVNALRRLCLSSIETLAIDDIKIIKNSSPFPGSFIENRIYLLVLNQNIEDYENVELELDIKNNGEDILDVNRSNIVTKLNGNIIPNDTIFYQGKTEYEKDVTILRLKPGQEFSFEAKITKGTKLSKEHPKFAAVSNAVVTHKMDRELAIKKSKETDNPENYMLADAEFDIKRLPNGEPETYVFQIKSIGPLSSEVIFEESMKILMNKIQNIIDNIDNKSKIKISETNETNLNGYSFEILGENDTVVNILNDYLQQKTFYAGRMIPHPHSNVILLKTKLSDKNTEENNKQNFIDTCYEIIEHIQNLYSEWNKLTTVVKKKIIKKK